LALSGAFLIALFAAGCGDEGPSPEPPPPPVTAPEKLAERVLTNLSPHIGETGGIYVDKSFWVDEERSRSTTVRAKLIELGASLRDGKVVDAAGKELFFFYVQNYSPRGPKHYEKNQEELREMEKKYHVVRMYPPKPRPE
jgi:hypothetical protein